MLYDIKVIAKTSTSVYNKIVTLSKLDCWSPADVWKSEFVVRKSVYGWQYIMYEIVGCRNIGSRKGEECVSICLTIHTSCCVAAV